MKPAIIATLALALGLGACATGSHHDPATQRELRAAWNRSLNPSQPPFEPVVNIQTYSEKVVRYRRLVPATLPPAEVCDNLRRGGNPYKGRSFTDGYLLYPSCGMDNPSMHDSIKHYQGTPR